MPTHAACFPTTRSGVFLICESAIPPRTIATMAGTGPMHSQPTVMLMMPMTIDAVARPLLGGWALASGGGCHAGAAGGGGCHGDGGEPAPRAGGFQLAGSFGKTTSGGCGAMIVGGGSPDAAGSSIRVVPSCVQKLSHSSSNVSLQLGQRFILRAQASHENRESVDHEYDDPESQVGGPHTDPNDRKRLASVMDGIILDLSQRDGAQNDGSRSSEQADAATPSNRDAKNSENQRSDGQALLLSRRHRRRRRWLPHLSGWSLRRIAPGQIKGLLALRICHRGHGNMNGWGRLWRQRSGGDQRRSVFGTEPQPFLIECSVASRAAFHKKK